MTRAMHKSERKLYVEMTFAIVAVAGEAQGAVAVARDVTERVLREKAAAEPQNDPPDEGRASMNRAALAQTRTMR